ADENATGRFYILTDDDCLPTRDDIIERGLTELASHPGFAILSAWPENAIINRWTPNGYMPYEDEGIMEHVSVGGMRFMRRGCLEEWPLSNGAGYDAEHCKALRDLEFRVGYLRNDKIRHLGEGKSSLWI